MLAHWGPGLTDLHSGDATHTAPDRQGLSRSEGRSSPSARLGVKRQRACGPALPTGGRFMSEQAAVASAPRRGATRRVVSSHPNASVAFGSGAGLGPLGHLGGRVEWSVSTARGRRRDRGPPRGLLPADRQARHQGRGPGNLGRRGVTQDAALEPPAHAGRETGRRRAGNRRRPVRVTIQGLA